MNTKSIFHFLTLVSLFGMASVLITSCQKEDTNLIPNDPITARTPPPDVPALLQVPAGNEVSFHTYATGVQVYVCRETSPGVYAWVFKAPIAALYANANYNGQVGTHYAGPTWESNSGSKVVGVRLQGVTVDPTAIPWLLLQAVSSQGPGVFEGTTYIQRTNTTGGLAPTTGANAGSVGQEVSVAYTAEYFFYTAI